MTVKCQYCPKEFSNKHRLAQHIRIHTGERPYKCSKCSAAFRQHPHLSQHIKNAVYDPPKKCPYCKMRYCSPKLLSCHVKTHPADRTVSLKIKQNAIKVRLTKQQPKVKKLKCKNCSFVAVTNKGLLTHLRTHESHVVSKRYKCSKCSYSFSQSHHLAAHEAVMSKENVLHKCSECKFKSCTAPGLVRHVSKQHKTVVQKHKRKTSLPQRPKVVLKFQKSKTRTSPEEESDMEKSEESEEEYKIKSEATDESEHEDRKSEKKPGRPRKRIKIGTTKDLKDIVFSCPFCDFEDPNPENIRSHMKTHTGDKPYQCPLCPVNFAYWYLLRAHVEIHKKDKEFKCNLCPTSYDHKCNLSVHMKEVHASSGKSVAVAAADKLKKKSKAARLPKPAVKKTVAKVKSSPKSPNKEGQFKCAFCEYSTDSRRRMQSHVMKHTGDSDI